MRRVALAILAPAILAGCGQQGEVYPMPEGQVRTAIATIADPPPVFGSVPLDMSSTRGADGDIVWTLTRPGGSPMLRFIAHTEAEDAGNTRVWVEVAGPTDKENDPVSKRLAENDSIRDLYQIAMAEQIDATLEKREFDYSRIAAATSRAALANMDKISLSSDEAAAESKRQAAKNITRAYEEEANGQANPASGWDTDSDYGQPMDNGAGY